MLERLDTPPAKEDGFFWADYAELRALAHPDQCFSRGDLDGTRRRAVDFEIRFDTEERWRLATNFHSMRAQDFGNDYPFRVSDDGDTLTVDFANQPARRLYLGLLLASSMRYIVKARQAEVARSFEKTSFEVFSSLMPAGSQVRATWAGGGPEAPYRGRLFQKMQAVARDIRCTPNFRERDFRPNDNGDGGIDLIAWHPMSDDREGIPISFAQCGCSRDDWRFKQLEASPSKHFTNLPVRHPWATYYFMPLDLRESDSDWAYKSDIGAAIVVDRLRLLRLTSQADPPRVLPAMEFVDEARNLGYA